MKQYIVSYADTDAGGVLHHAKYVEIAERGRHHWLKQRQLSFSQLTDEYNLSLVVHDISANYKAAIFLEDEINIRTQLKKIDRAGLEWLTHIEKNGNMSCKVTTKMVCLNAKTKSIVSVPNFLISELGSQIEPYQR
jgi:acyl-CoA thioester hydrolase